MAQEKIISAELRFKDGFSDTVAKATAGVHGVAKTSEKGVKTIKKQGDAFKETESKASSFSKTAKKGIDSITSSIEKQKNKLGELGNSLSGKITEGVKWATLGIAGLGVASAVMGTKGAMEAEVFRAQLDGIYKDANKAAEAFEYAKSLSAGGWVSDEQAMNAVMTMQINGMKPQEFLNELADFAADRGKNLDQVADVFVNIKRGRTMGLKEFGLDEKQVADFGKKIGLTNFIDSKGTIKDANKFMLALTKLLESKHKGGLKRMEETVVGGWKGIKAKTGDIMAQMIGSNADGSARIGSAFDFMKNKTMGFNKKLDELAESGKLDEWAKNFDDGVVNVLSLGFGALSDGTDSFIKWLQELKKEDIKEWANTVKETLGAVSVVVNTTAKGFKAIADGIGWMKNTKVGNLVGATTVGAAAGTKIGGFWGGIAGAASGAGGTIGSWLGDFTQNSDWWKNREEQKRIEQSELLLNLKKNYNPSFTGSNINPFFNSNPVNQNINSTIEHNKKTGAIVNINGAININNGIDQEEFFRGIKNAVEGGV